MFKYENKNRLLDFNLNVENEYCWKFFIDNFILNLVAVAQHYSIRYANSEKYLKTRIENNEKIFIFDNDGDEHDLNLKLITYFYDKSIDQDIKSFITVNELYFLWRTFMNKENIPFIFTKDGIINKLLIYFQSNGIVVKDKKYIVLQIRK